MVPLSEAEAMDCDDSPEYMNGALSEAEAMDCDDSPEYMNGASVRG